MKRFLALLALALPLAACDPPQPGERVDTQPRLADPAPAPRGPGLCVGCVGPHINLMTGRLELFSMGPGLSLF